MELAAGTAVVGSFFGYNRENYFFDGEQLIKRAYQEQSMRVKQFELFRQDIRDLMNLTVSKMDNYLIVNTIQIGLVVVLFTEGRPKCGRLSDDDICRTAQIGEAPNWLLFLWGATGAGSFMYITLCIWLAMHASICCHSFCVRILTQVVRLPIPTQEELDAARVVATDFEGKKVREMLRIPVVKEQFKKFREGVDQLTEGDSPTAGAGANVEAEEAETMLDADGRPVAADTLEHVRLYRKMQANWQAYDAYARVSMSMGTNQLLQQLGYTCLIGFIIENKSIWPGIGSVAIFSICAAMLIRLDLYLPFISLAISFFLNMCPPVIAGICLILDPSPRTNPSSWQGILCDGMVPVIFFLHIMWLILLLKWAKGKKINNIILPMTFRAVLYLDVFGWLSSREVPQALVAAAEGRPQVQEGNRPRHLGTVTEEEQSAPEPMALDAPQPANFEGGCRSSLRESLAKLCAELRHSLERDLQCFEAADLEELIDHWEKQEVQELRAQLKEVIAEASSTTWEAAQAASSMASDADATVWVRLDWNASGRSWPYFRRVRNGTKVHAESSIVWDRPMPPDVVLELTEIRVRLENFKNKVHTLVSQFPQEVGHREASFHETSSCRLVRGSSNGSAASEQLWHASERAFQPPDASQQQTSNDSVQLAESGVTQDADAEAGGLGGHPHRRPLGEGESRTDATYPWLEPGQLPWNTVKHGSLILIGTWCLAFVFTILRLVLPVGILDPHDLQTAEMQLLYDGPWPRFFEPKGLACSDATELLIAEKHDVHRLVQDEDAQWSLMRSQREAECLSKAPEFHAAGLHGISLDCGEVRPCSSLLVAEDGRSALKCEQNNSQLLHFFGGPWHLASTVGASGTGLWAHGAVDMARPVLLQASGGGSRSYVPVIELGPHPAAMPVEFLDTLQAGGLLALSGGQLRAWQPLPPSSHWFPSDWSYDLPKALGLRWLGLCAARNGAFLLGRGPGRMELWRLHLSSL